MALVVVACAAPARPVAWPETNEGKLANGWVAAFSAGEDAMRRFWQEHLAAANLAAKSMDERMKGYRDLRERVETLRLIEVLDAATPGELTVTLADAHDVEHEFIFHFETAEPRKLTGVTAKLVQKHSLFPH